MSATTHSSVGPDSPKLLDRMRSAIRVRHYSIRTEEAYLSWVRRFISFHRAHPRDLAADDINRFLTDLAVRGKVAASTQRQALSASLSEIAPAHWDGRAIFDILLSHTAPATHTAAKNVQGGNRRAQSFRVPCSGLEAGRRSPDQRGHCQSGLFH